MGEYSFSIATRADRPAIVSFMRAHWDTPHPLIELDDFFEYYYAAPNGRLNFALCKKGGANGALAALAGFIPASAGPKPDVWVSLWVADKTAKGSGLELMAALPALTGCRTLACNNIRPETRPFYEFLGYTTGRVGHYYRLAPRTGYAIAQISSPTILPVGGTAQLRLLATPAALHASGFVPPTDANPYKDLAYIEKRYFAFPRQQYRLYAACPATGGPPAALLATRLAAANGSAALRIADYIGPADFLPGLGAAIDDLLQTSGAEYADLYCAGLPSNLLEEAGFSERQTDDPNIIPTYLDPPLIQNIEYYYFTSNPQGFTLFKADGDQDRPNIPLG